MSRDSPWDLTEAGRAQGQSLGHVPASGAMLPRGDEEYAAAPRID